MRQLKHQHGVALLMAVIGGIDSNRNDCFTLS